MDRTRQERYNLIYGNTVKKLDQEPIRQADPQRKRKPSARPVRKEATPQTKRNQKRAREFDFAFVRVLVAALVVVAGVSFFYLTERAKLMNQRTILAQKKSQLNVLQVENEDLNLEIEQSINLGAVQAAAERYGMKKPSAKQIIRYDSKEAEYVRQYGKIPKAD